MATQVERQLQIPNTSINIASQRPNPKVNMDYLHGNEFGIPINDYTLSVQHTIELGGKRQNRIDKARVQSDIEKKSMQLGLKQYFVKQIQNYQRYAQLDILIKTINEAITTFDNLTNKLEQRSRLTPEENISVSTLKLASNDYKVQLNSLNNERDLLKGDLEFSTDCFDINAAYKKLNYNRIKNEIVNEDSGLIEIEKNKLQKIKQLYLPITSLV